ncbi:MULTISPECIES: hypothetical protein [unclassified Micromonospora]
MERSAGVNSGLSHGIDRSLSALGNQVGRPFTTVINPIPVFVDPRDRLQHSKLTGFITGLILPGRSSLVGACCLGHKGGHETLSNFGDNDQQWQSVGPCEQVLTTAPAGGVDRGSKFRFKV